MRITARIPKEVPILLIGNDLDGKVFSEPTNTVLLSLHGAGIVSRHKLSPEQELILRCLDRNSETAVPYVVGQISIFIPAQIISAVELPEEKLFRYGVAFLQPAKRLNQF